MSAAKILLAQVYFKIIFDQGIHQAFFLILDFAFHLFFPTKLNHGNRLRKMYQTEGLPLDVTMDGENSPLMVATQRTAVSLVKCFNGEQRKILYPEI